MTVFIIVIVCCVYSCLRKKATLKHLQSSTWVILFCMLQQLMENKEFIFVKDRTANGISTLGGSEVFRKGSATITYSKDNSKGTILYVL